MARRGKRAKADKKQLVVVRVEGDKTRQQQPQQRRANKGRPRPRQNAQSVGMNGDKCVRELARSMIQPWAYSSCVPDGTRFVKPFTVKQTGTLTTGTAGTCFGVALGLQPDAFVYEDSASTIAAPKITGSWSNAQAIATIVAQFNMYRVVSAGIRIWYTGSTLNDQGVILVGQMSSQNNLFLINNETLGTLSSTTANYKISALRDGATLTWRPEDNHAQADLFDVDSTAQVVGSNLDHSYLIAWVYGAATNGASSVQYEVSVNFEGQLGQQTFIPGGVGPQPTDASPGWYEKLGNMIKSIPTFATPAIEYASSAYSVYNAVRGQPSRTLRTANRIEL